jgi:ubiquinone/menaquinone biosynthesis C-methylase UbiE
MPEKLEEAVYDALNPWGPADDFYLDLVGPAPSVVDVGCGTGELLSRARRAGHDGFLAGVDPSPGMLAQAAAKREDISWIRGTAQALNVGRTVDLVTMTGHAFQVLLDDDAVRQALAAFHRALNPGGRLAFETRNPAARAWESWTPEHSHRSVPGPNGTLVEVTHQVRRTRPPDLVDFTTTLRTVDATSTVDSTLRFIGPQRLRSHLDEAGFGIEGWYGWWDRGPVTATSPEIIVVARAEAQVR